MEMNLDYQEVKRSFTIESDLLKKFKEKSKEKSKTYKRTITEAMELWIKVQNKKE